MKKIMLVLFLLNMFNIMFSLTDKQKQTLMNLSNELKVQQTREKIQVYNLADSLGLVIRQEFSNGKIIQLMKFKDNFPLYYETNNAEGANLIKANRLYPTGAAGLSLSGNGITLGIWDGGATYISHQEFGTRVTQQDGSTTQSNHATHVAGTMAASGIVGSARGMSYQADLLAYDWDSDASEMASAAANGLKVSNHSYGLITGWSYNSSESQWYWYGDTRVSQTDDYRFGFYDSNAQLWDNIAKNAPGYLIVKAAGNDRGEGPAPGTSHKVWNYSTGNWVNSTVVRNVDGGVTGYDCISAYGVSKNVLTVGAVNAQQAMSSFSGWGPTDDGRIKPDIVAKGVGVYSTYNSHSTAYGNMNGTSMATPMVSGAIGLLLQHQQNLHPGQNLLSSTIKALVIHTANTNISGALGPDYRFGWGLMDTEKAASVMTQNANEAIHIYENILQNQGNIQIPVIASGSEPLQATIVWTDIPGNPVSPALDPTNLMLVNDLDLRILDYSQNTYLPYILDPANPANPASTGDNTRDNVEVVFIQNPVPGETYTIVINHKNNLHQSNAQSYSLIVTGNLSNGLLPPLNLTGQAGDSEVVLDWNSINDTDFLYYKLYRNGSLLISDLLTNYYTDTSVNNGESYTYYVTAVYVDGESNPSNYISATPSYNFSLLPPRNLTANVNQNDVLLEWDEPYSDIVTFTHSVSETFSNSIGTGSSAIFTVAQRFDVGQLSALNVTGGYLTEVSIMGSHETALYALKVWTGGSGTPLTAGTLAYEQNLGTLTEGSWNNVSLTSPVLINADNELWIGYEVDTPGGYPAAADIGPAYDNYGNLMNLGSGWTTLSNLSSSLNYNWMIKGTVIVIESSRLYAQQRSFLGYNVYRDNVLLNQSIVNQTSFSDLGVPNGNYSYSVRAVYSEGISNAVTEEVNISSQTYQNISLINGWNIISSYIIPDNPNMMSVFSSLTDNQSLVKVQDEAGNSLEYLPYLSQWVNFIGNIEIAEGYRVKVSETTSLLINGSIVELPLTVPLTEGWNLISYPYSSSGSAMDFLQSLIDDDYLVKVQDEAGNAIEYLINSWENGIGNFVPGKGYAIRVNNDCDLVFNALPGNIQNYSLATSLSKSIKQNIYFNKAWSGNGWKHFNVYLIFEDGVLGTDDEIAIFDGDICVASTVYENEKSLISLISSLNDSVTESVNGYSAGNLFTIKYWKAIEQKEYILTDIELLEGNMIFAVGESALLKVNSLNHVNNTPVNLATNINSIYPNPFNPVTNIRFSIKNDDFVIIEIYNVKGQKVNNLSADFLKAGYHTITWNGTDSNYRKVTSGIYFVRLKTADAEITQKVLMLK